ncbi:MAG: hypothetical protein Q8L57_03085, partial [bacterium]|nr:hypothetical protein [bacterium]
IPEKESYTLPEGYKEWNLKEEKFPGVKCGIRAYNPVIRLEDGSVILGSECYWKLADEKLQKEFEELKKRVWEEIQK